MGYQFPDSWTDEIAEISTLPEYQTAVIKIVDPSSGNRTYNPDTNTWTGSLGASVYEGQARIIGIRWSVFYGGEASANAQNITGVRVQLPREKDGGTSTFSRIRRGYKMFVTDCPQTPVLKDMIFSVSSDFQGSSSASRTIEFALDGDVAKGA